jgi:hypothetical protein
MDAADSNLKWLVAAVDEPRYIPEALPGNARIH